MFHFVQRKLIFLLHNVKESHFVQENVIGGFNAKVVFGDTSSRLLAKFTVLKWIDTVSLLIRITIIKFEYKLQIIAKSLEIFIIVHCYENPINPMKLLVIIINKTLRRA